MSLLAQQRESRRSAAERAALGRAVRDSTPLAALGGHVRGDTSDPVELLAGQAHSRVPELVPVRHGRMASSAFAFYRGAALVMADDLSQTPNSGLEVQLCGDAHLSNFGFFATPERRLAFDVNDFDETYPGPFEWDVKRLVASLAIAARENRFTAKDAKRITRACAAEYRETIARQAGTATLAVWYSRVSPDASLTELREVLDSSSTKNIRRQIEKAWTRDSVQALTKLTAVVDGERRFVSAPPLIVPLEELVPERDANEIHAEFAGRLAHFRSTMQSNHQILLDQFELLRVARKVVGVGSVGTRAWVLLLRGIDDRDPLVLQAKEAQRSVLAGYLDGPKYANEGERVVRGQRLTQAASDVFLGWEAGPGFDGVPRDFYVRQLRDGKGSVVVEALNPSAMEIYGRICGRVLAYGHARSGDRIAIAAYLDSGDDFDRAMSKFAAAYVEQNLADHRAFVQAIEQGRISAEFGL